jgi:hypothetical protein
MGKGTEEWRAETKRCQHTQKENDVSRRSKEDCSSAASAMGEGEGCPKENRISTASVRNGTILTNKATRRMRGDR